MYSCHRRRQHRGVRTTRLCRTLWPRASVAALSVHRNPPLVVTTADAHSGWDGMAVVIALIPASDKAKYFLFWGLTRFCKPEVICPSGRLAACGAEAASENARPTMGAASHSQLFADL